MTLLACKLSCQIFHFVCNLYADTCRRPRNPPFFNGFGRHVVVQILSRRYNKRDHPSDGSFYYFCTVAFEPAFSDPSMLSTLGTLGCGRPVDDPREARSTDRAGRRDAGSHRRSGERYWVQESVLRIPEASFILLDQKGYKKAPVVKPLPRMRCEADFTSGDILCIIPVAELRCKS